MLCTIVHLFLTLFVRSHFNYTKVSYFLAQVHIRKCLPVQPANIFLPVVVYVYHEPPMFIIYFRLNDAPLLLVTIGLFALCRTQPSFLCCWISLSSITFIFVRVWPPSSPFVSHPIMSFPMIVIYFVIIHGRNMVRAPIVSFLTFNTRQFFRPWALSPPNHVMSAHVLFAFLFSSQLCISLFLSQEVNYIVITLSKHPKAPTIFWHTYRYNMSPMLSCVHFTILSSTSPMYNPLIIGSIYFSLILFLSIKSTIRSPYYFEYVPILLWISLSYASGCFPSLTA